MVFCILIRGPLGVGKSTVAERLAKEIRAEVISIDRILDDHGLWKEGIVSEFLNANEIAARTAQVFLEKGIPVVFEGNLYWMAQIEDLERRLHRPVCAFTLDAPVEVCILRDSGRELSHGEQAAREVFAKAAKVSYGISIDATKSVDESVARIRSYLLG
jgi:thymidylate kinase